MDNDNQETTTSSVSESTSDSPNRKLDKKTKILIGVGAIVLLGLIGIGSFLWGSFSGQAEPSPSPTPTASASATPDSEVESSPSPTPSASPEATPTPSPSPTPEPVTQSKSLSADSDLDGFQSSNGGGNDGIDIRTGRNVNLITRGFVSFDLSDIPDGAVIESVRLALYQTEVIGDPFGVGIRIKVDHLDYGDSFENSDYSGSSISGSFATLTSDSSVGWKEVDVADQVKADIAAGRIRSQFRLHLATENIGGDATGDFVKYESSDNSEGTGNRPQLNVRYH